MGTLKNLDALAEAMASALTARVGFLEGATHADDDGNSTPTAQVAASNEFGDETHPTRPFMRRTVSEDSDKWVAYTGKALKGTGYNVDQALNLTGVMMKEAIQSRINTWATPPNSGKTIQRKGFNAPLRDSMQMLRSVDFEVTENGEPGNKSG